MDEKGTIPSVGKLNHEICGQIGGGGEYLIPFANFDFNFPLNSITSKLRERAKKIDIQERWSVNKGV